MTKLHVEWISDHMGKCANCFKVQQGYYSLIFGVCEEFPQGFMRIKLCKRCRGSLRKKLGD